MTRVVSLLGAVLALVAAPVAAQESFLPTPPGQIETILQLLDAVEAAEAAVLVGDGLSEAELEDLEELPRVADVIGAQDLAARARSLLVLARPAVEEAPRQPAVDVPLEPAREDRLARDGDRFRAMTNALAATGGTALVLSAGFYALAERDYQRWLVAPDEASGAALYRSWRAYEVLSLGLGGGALLTAGVGVPLLFAAATPSSAYAVPPAREAYTEEERAARLNELYGQRAQIVTALNRYDQRGPRRELTGTIGVATGVIGSIASATLYYVAEERYQRYLDAPFSDDAERLGRQVRLFDILAASSAGLAAAGFATSASISVLTDDKQELEDALRRVNRRIITVRNAPAIEVPPRGGVQRRLEPEETDEAAADAETPNADPPDENTSRPTRADEDGDE